MEIDRVRMRLVRKRDDAIAVPTSLAIPLAHVVILGYRTLRRREFPIGREIQIRQFGKRAPIRLQSALRWGFCRLRPLGHPMLGVHNNDPHEQRISRWRQQPRAEKRPSLLSMITRANFMLRRWFARNQQED
jgi:hypothetical protein